jgi:hypothetical protein
MGLALALGPGPWPWPFHPCDKDASDLRNSDIKFQLYSKLKWHNKANRRELALTKGFDAIQ